MKTVWVFIGVIGSGKDYSASKLQKEIGGDIYGFSDGVRELTFKFLGWVPKTPQEYDEFKLKVFDFIMPNGEKITCDGRKFLENVGETMRKYDEHFWARYLIYQKVERDMVNGVENIIIKDCRYPNEANLVFSICEERGYTPKFFFTNYKSERYEIRDDVSEKFAQKLLKLGCEDCQNITEIVKEFVNNE